MHIFSVASTLPRRHDALYRLACVQSDQTPETFVIGKNIDCWLAKNDFAEPQLYGIDS